MILKIKPLRIGLILIIVNLFFGIGLGISFGLAEDSYKSHIHEQVEKYIDVHDVMSEGKIWRYVQRAHFHSLGISAFLLGLILLIGLQDLSLSYKRTASIFLGLGTFYSYAWFFIFYFSMTEGRHAAHENILTQLFINIGVGGILVGLCMVLYSLVSPKKKQ